MDVLTIDPETVVIRLTNNELRVLNNSLNEVCHAIDVPEFHARIGAHLSDVKALLNSVNQCLTMMLGRTGSPGQ